MELYASPTSPYARLVRGVFIEKDIADQVEIHWLNPWESPQALISVNPFCRVPTLVTDDGRVLVENLLIALYLERHVPQPPLLADPERAWPKLGLAQGLIDAAVDIAAGRRLRKLPEDDPILTRRREAFPRAIERVAGLIDQTPPSTPDLGDLALAVALEYLDFRIPEFDWRVQSPALASWHAELARRESLAATAPPPA